MTFGVSGLEERSLFEDADFVFSLDHLQSSASKTRKHKEQRRLRPRLLSKITRR